MVRMDGWERGNYYIGPDEGHTGEGNIMHGT
jgi:hypothetical protein